MLLVWLLPTGRNIKMREPFTWKTNIKSLYDKIKGIRAAEGLGGEEYDSVFINMGYETFTTSDLDITRAYDTFLGGYCYDNIALNTGKTYKITFDYVWNGGNKQPAYRVASNQGLSAGLQLNELLTGTDAYTFYSSGQAYHGFINTSFGTDFAVSNLSVTEVL